MPHSTQRSLQALILAALGLFFLQKIWSGTLYWYINERFLILTLFGGLAFLALARRALEARGHHGHSHLSGRSLAVMSLPLVLGLLIPARPLGAGAIANKGLNAATTITGNAGAALNVATVPPERRSVLDWVRAFNYSADPTEFAGQPVDVIGFVYHDARLPAEQFFVSRFAVACCVADASAIAMLVETADAAAWKDNAWVRVTGALAVGQFEGRPLPQIVVERLEATTPPAQPYLYP